MQYLPELVMLPLMDQLLFHQTLYRLVQPMICSNPQFFDHYLQEEISLTKKGFRDDPANNIRNYKDIFSLNKVSHTMIKILIDIHPSLIYSIRITQKIIKTE